MSRDCIYRTGARYPVMITWTILITAAFLVSLWAMSGRSRAEHASLLYALGVAVCLFGPVCLGVYLLRRCRVFIRVDDEKGLFIRGRELLRWDQIRKVEAVRGLLGLGTQKEPVQLSSAGGIHQPETLGDAIDRVSEGYPSKGAFLLCLLAPFISIFSPWHPRVIITLQDRRCLVFHELERDLEFCLRCVPRIREHQGIVP